MAKTPRKAIMARSKLKNWTITNWNNCNYQQSFLSNLLWKTKFCYFRNLNVKDLHNNKKLWKKWSLFFKKSNLIIDNQKLANLFNTYFINITNIYKSPSNYFFLWESWEYFQTQREFYHSKKTLLERGII